jgi:hypothetical protein
MQDAFIDKLGHKGALFVQTLHYDLSQSNINFGIIKSGIRWIWRTMDGWAQKIRTSVSSVERLVKKLMSLGAIKKTYYFLGMVRLNAFTIDYEKLQSIINDENSSKNYPVEKPVEKQEDTIERTVKMTDLTRQNEGSYIDTKNPSKNPFLSSSTSENSSSDQISNPPSAADGASDSSILPLESDLEYAEISDLDEISEEEERIIACMMETEELPRESTSTEVTSRRVDNKAFTPKFSKYKSNSEKIAHWQETLFPSTKQTAKKINSSMPVTTPGSSEHNSLLEKWRKILCPS